MKNTLILLNKPYRVMCKFTDASGRDTLADFVDVPQVYPAGRLDYDSEGLVLLTNNGKLQSLISHPRHKLAKTYWVQVENIPDKAALQALRRGITLKDGPAQATDARLIPEPPQLWPRNPPIRQRKSIPTAWLSLSITEGRNRQVRRMTAAVGYPTLRLIRQAVGPWALQDLQPGQWQKVYCPQNPPDFYRVVRKGGK